MVRGHEKIKLHLMFGVIALFADQLIRKNNMEFKQDIRRGTLGFLNYFSLEKKYDE